MYQARTSISNAIFRGGGGVGGEKWLFVDIGGIVYNITV